MMKKKTKPTTGPVSREHRIAAVRHELMMVRDYVRKCDPYWSPNATANAYKAIIMRLGAAMSDLTAALAARPS